MTDFVPAPARVPVHFVFSAVRATWRLRHTVPRVRTVAPRPVEQVVPPFTVTVDRPARVLRVVGDFDLAAVDRFGAAGAGLAVGDRGDVTVDLGGVRFIDAAGMGALVAFGNVLAETGRGLRVRGVDARTRRLFGVAGLSGLLPPG